MDGEVILRERSGMEAEKRMIRSRISGGGEVDIAF